MREISLNILDIIQNSIAAFATVITAGVKAGKNKLIVKICDNGKGMDKKTLKAVLSPFATSRKTRGVGLGLPLLKQSAAATGGSVKIRSKKGKGTKVCAVFKLSSIDMMPMGDLGETAYTLILTNTAIDFIFKVSSKKGRGAVDTRAIKSVLKEMPMDSPPVAEFLKEHIRQNITELLED